MRRWSHHIPRVLSVVVSICFTFSQRVYSADETGGRAMEDAVSRLESAGAKFLRDNGGTPYKASLSNRRITDERLRDLRSIPTLWEVDLRGSSVTDGGLAYLSALAKLKALRLPANASDRGVLGLPGYVDLTSFSAGGTRVGDGTVTWVGNRKDLEYVDLCGTAITDKSISQLRGLRQLRWLDLGGTPVGDLGVAQLENMVQLDYLSLLDTRVTDASMASVSKLVNLRYLTLPDSITDAGLRHLAPLRCLRELVVANANISDVGVRELLALKELKMLSLHGTRVSDAGVRATIVRMPNLTDVNLGNTMVTASGANFLRSQRPSIVLQWPD